MNLPLFFLFSFLMGSIPTAYLFARFLKNIDIRQYGSGNSGTTNAFRVLGWGPGAAVLAIDFLKGFFPVILFLKACSNLSAAHPEFLIGVGFTTILGHVFTPFLGFKGGKGVATGAGVLCAGFFQLFLPVLLVWFIVFFFTRIVSVSSITALFSLVIFSIFFKMPAAAALSFLGVFLFSVWTHRSNILRLLKSQENQFKPH